MSNIPQARELIEQALLTCVIDPEARSLLRKALRLMRRKAAVLLLALLWAPHARAEDNMPVIPDEATKIRALKRAYELNNNSMVGWGGSIDLSKEDLSVDPAVQVRLPPVSELPPKKGRKP